MDPIPPVVLSTGGASGIGRHVAQTLLARGYRMVVTDIDFAGLQAAFDPENERCLLLAMDVARPGDWQTAIEAALQRFGRLDYLLNIAGVIMPGYAHQTGLDQIDRQFDINAKGVAYGIRLAGEVMFRQGSGHIINIASLAGVAPVAGLALYSASKFAVRALSIAAAYDMRPHGVYVSVICPDLVDTPMLDLQLHYEEAAMTFSGPRRPLSVADVEQALLRVMQTKAVEVTLPITRGWMAKLGNLFPGLGLRITQVLSRKGLARLRALRNKGKSF